MADPAAVPAGEEELVDYEEEEVLEGDAAKAEQVCARPGPPAASPSPDRAAGAVSCASTAVEASPPPP